MIGAHAMADAYRIKWLRDLSPDLQQRYFEARHRSYADVWGRRGVPISDGFGFRDEYDGEEVAAVIDERDNIVGGVRANIVRPSGAAARELLPMEKYYDLEVRSLYPEHNHDRISYAEASRLFLADGGNWMQDVPLKLRLLNFLLENVPAVDVTYFVLPTTTLRAYRLLARLNRVESDFRTAGGLHPNASKIGGEPTVWGVFACLHTVAR